MNFATLSRTSTSHPTRYEGELNDGVHVEIRYRNGELSVRLYDDFETKTSSYDSYKTLHEFNVDFGERATYEELREFLNNRLLIEFPEHVSEVSAFRK